MRSFPMDPQGWSPGPRPVGPPYEIPAPFRPRPPLWRRMARGLLLILLGYYVLCILLLLLFRFVDPPTTGVRIERRIEAMLARREYRERQRDLSLDRMSPHLPRAVVAAEDGRFWTHWGFDLKEMGRAGREVLEGDRPRGASTITQQLMKNLFGCTCRNPIRKAYDLALTPPAELILGKRRILELYLNNVEWGQGIFGAEEAARHHYGARARGLSRTQAAGLAALLPNPLRRTTGNTGEYRSEILRRMSRRGW